MTESIFQYPVTSYFEIHAITIAEVFNYETINETFPISYVTKIMKISEYKKRLFEAECACKTNVSCYFSVSEDENE